LIDDRPVASAGWPLEPERLVEQAGALLDRRTGPLSLRERERRAWVTGRVERLYAGLDLPGLRQAIDPRNADRPVLLLGEPGTGGGLLARYIHNLAEPAREALLVLPPAALPTPFVESHILELSAGRRVTIFLDGLDATPPAVQAELAHCLRDSGMLGIEPIGWIASVTRWERLDASLRELVWLRVELPPLRLRSDLNALASALTARAAERLGRSVSLSPSAAERIRGYGWPGNLRELEGVIEASVAGTHGELLEAHDLRIGATAERPVAPQPEPAVEEPADAEPEVVVPLEFAEDEPSGEPGPETPVPQRLIEALRPTSLSDISAPLAEELRRPLLAIRTCAALLEQRPDDATVRRELARVVEGDLAEVEQSLARLERFAGFGRPILEEVDLAALAAGELERRRARMRARSLVVLEELDTTAPRARADEVQLRFALGGLLDRALRMTPEGGDLYVGSHYQPESPDEPAGHRLLLRFHSPEDVLVPPEGVPGPPPPLEVVFARALVEGMGGIFVVDASGSQDNLVLIEFPA
jgi:signal transduction histidine kinase